MDDLTTRLRRLGKLLSNVSDRAADPTTLSNARRRWLSTSSKQVATRKLLSGFAAPDVRGLSRQRWIGMAVAFAAVAALIVGLFVAAFNDRVISFAIGGKAEQGTLGEWVAPEGKTSLDLRFSEGTVVTVSEGARVRVTDTTPRGAALLVEKGSITAVIKHLSPTTNWSVRAGPYEVTVTGTSFEAKWDPAKETFELLMLEGSVIVSGPRLPVGRPIVSGEHLIVSADRMELRAGAAPPPNVPFGTAVPSASAAPSSSALVAPLQGPTPSASPADVHAPKSPSAGSAQPASESSSTAFDSSWKSLAKSGKYKEAMALVEQTGFAAEASKSSSSDLLILADIARFSGRPGQAKEALLLARQRGARGLTTFLLGKIAADQLHSPGEAVNWFETYLQESAGGALAEQALGRIMEMRKRDPGAAKLTAQRYLARYPSGAYAALARSLLDSKLAPAQGGSLTPSPSPTKKK